MSDPVTAFILFFSKKNITHAMNTYYLNVFCYGCVSVRDIILIYNFVLLIYNVEILFYFVAWVVS